jgi:hypothetical protein
MKAMALPELGAVGAVGEGVALRRGVAGKGIDVIHLEREVGEVRPDDHGAARVVFADFDQFLALGRLEEDELGAAPGGEAVGLLEAEDLLVKGTVFSRSVTR